MPKWISYSLLIISLAGYFVSGYFIDRRDFGQLITVYTILFLAYFVFLSYRDRSNLNNLIAAGLLFRFILVFSVPALSDDFYRFLWDGHIQHLGFNPFDFTPRQFLNQHSDPYLQQLFPKLNSPDYYSVYPQLCQTLFKLAANIAGESIQENIIVLKSVLFLSELGSIFLLQKLLSAKNLNPNLSLYYILNPLVIIELTGNIHFEAIMIFFILLAAWYIHKQKQISSASAMTLAIQAKLIPIIAIPLLIKEIGFRKTVWYSLACLLLMCFLSSGLLNTPERFFHFFESLQLYFGKFEFNGSLYIVFRSIGWWILDYNPIAVLSKIMLVLSLTGMLYIYYRKMNLLSGFFWLLIVYLGCSAIVHPWYLSPLIALSAFVRYRFVLIWSALIPLTYITYSSIPYNENYWLVGLEYLVTLGWFIWEYNRMNTLRSVPGKAFILHKNPVGLQNN